MKNSPFHPVHQQSDVSSKILLALEKLSESFRVLLWDAGKEEGLSPIQVQLLIFIASHPEPLRTVNALAAEFNLTKPTISDSVKSLEQKNYLSRTVHSADARSFVFSVTTEGLLLVQKLERYPIALYEAIDQLEDHDRENILSRLKRIIFLLNEGHVISTQRMCFNCRFYSGNRLDTHHCSFLRRALAAPDLRVDCPEFEKAQV